MFLRSARWAGVVAAALSVLALAACGSGSARGAGDGKPTIATGFYPLEYAASRIAGDRATVTSLTRPGTEPHDVELDLREAGAVQDADLVIYLKGFQPAIDEAVAERGDKPSLDVSRFVRDPHDPHFWLDPVLYGQVGDEIAGRLSTLDSAGASRFDAAAAGFRSDLGRLNADFAKGLAHCTSKHLVTSHEAFGYLAARYGFQQVGISGLTPEQEPTPAKLTELSTFVRENQVSTIYYETLVSPSVAEAIATETGADVAVLDPVEGLTDESKGDNYFEIMRSNLATLKKGQSCT